MPALGRREKGEEKGPPPYPPGGRGNGGADAKGNMIGPHFVLSPGGRGDGSAQPFPHGRRRGVGIFAKKDLKKRLRNRRSLVFFGSIFVQMTRNGGFFGTTDN